MDKIMIATSSSIPRRETSINDIFARILQRKSHHVQFFMKKVQLAKVMVMIHWLSMKVLNTY